MSLAPIPSTAPFEDEEIDLLNRVVAVANPTQRAWLAGFLAGVDAASGANTDVAPAVGQRAAEPLTILYATESGNSEALAANVAKAARKLSLKPTLIDMADLDLASLAGTKRLLVIAATWGEGEPPARATRIYNELMSDAAPRLEGTEFSVLALGDTAYVEFCAVGKKLDERLLALGAKRVAERVDCDLDFADPAAKWIDTALKALAPPADAGRGRVIPVDFAAKAPAVAALGPFEAEVTAHINLNSSRSGKETVHLELAFEGAVPAYKPGDSLDLFAENDPVYVDEFLKAVGLEHDAAVRADLTKNRDITTLSVKALETYAAASQNAGAQALLASGDAQKWIAGRQLIDLVETYPAKLTAEQLKSVTRPLAPRAYSIASSAKEVGNEAHLLVSAVRYESHGRARTGVASSFVADRLKKGAKVQVKLKPNRHFALPASDKDIIMVGPGTGVAPFRAFVQERRATGATGKSWLFFGDRHYNDDFLYQLEWQDAVKDGALSRMDVAFSRDGRKKHYVQDSMWERRGDLVNWIDGGATFYVCGDAKAMAKDVRATLVRAIADVKGVSAEAAEQAVQDLDRDKRYLQDTY